MTTARHKQKAAGGNPVLALCSLVMSVVFVAVSVIGAAHPSWAATASDNLNSFLTDVQISGIQPDANGVYKYRDGDEIGMRFTFAETEGTQFSNMRLYYQLPQGFEAVQTSGSFDVPVTFNGSVYTVHGNSWSIQDGKMVIQWNTADPNFTYLTSSANAKIVLGVNFKLRNVSGKVQLGNGVERTFQLDTSNDLAVQKNSQYDDQSGRMHYTVTIKSTGTGTNVQVNDAISGSAIVYDPSSLKVSGNSAQYNVEPKGNGFTFTTPIMGNGETITLTYDGKIDYAAFHGKVTADNSTNSVTAKSDGDSNPQNNTTSTNEQYNWQLQPSQWSGIGKSGKVDDAKGTSKHTVHWTVTANDKRRVSLAGGTITDSLDQYSNGKTQYSGDGVNIEVVDQSGKTVGTRHVTWAQLGIDPASGKAWTYQVPSTDGIYSYRITYDTVTDIAGSSSDVWVSNDASMHSDATGDQSTSSGVSVSAGGKGPDIKATKSVVASQSTYEHTAWKIDATVPAAGYSSFSITDTLPALWASFQDASGNWVSKNLIDSYIKDSLSITGLKQGESYTVDTSDPSKVVITFYRDAAHTKPGLGASSLDRTVSATLKTENNPQWLALGQINAWQATHQNKATVTANGQTKDVSASVAPVKQSITKQSAYSGTRTVNGTDLPVYKFTLTLDGVNGDTFDIDDEFDTSLFSFATTQQIGDWEQNWVLGGDQYYQGTKGTRQITWTNTAKGVAIHVPQGAVAKNNGAYYPKYRIVYYLIAKDAGALRTLNQRATDHNGTTTFTNTATWDGNSTGSIVSTYTYKTVTKEQTSVDPATHIATFRLNLNPKGTDINPSGDTLVLEDHMSTNMVPDVTSLHADPSGGVSFHLDPDTNILSITFPDRTPVTVTYSVYLKGSGNISYSNKASLYGQTSEVTQTTQLSNDSSSSASVPTIKILKNDSGNLSKPLAGAKFKLYRAKDNSSVTDREFTTGADGIATITGRQDQDGWSLFAGTKYYLVETQAPQGFTKRADKIYFTIKDNPTGTDEYPDSYTIPWSNTPEKTDTSFAVHKIDANTSASLQGAQFTLSGRRSTGEDITQTSMSTAGGMARFTGLKAGTYTLKETQAPSGYETPSQSHTIVVGADLGITYDRKPLAAGSDGTPATVTISNTHKRFFLPSTGHLGGLWLIMGAGGLVLGAGSVLMLADPRQSRHAAPRRFGKGTPMR